MALYLLTSITKVHGVYYVANLMNQIGIAISPKPFWESFNNIQRPNNLKKLKQELIAALFLNIMLMCKMIFNKNMFDYTMCHIFP